MVSTQRFRFFRSQKHGHEHEHEHEHIMDPTSASSVPPPNRTTTTTTTTPPPSSSSSSLPEPSPEHEPVYQAPLNLLAAFRSWVKMDEPEAERSEQRILRRLSFYRLPDEPDPEYPSLVGRSCKIPISDGTYMNCLEITSVRPPRTSTSEGAHKKEKEDDEEEGEANVLIHGYGMGLGFFYWNMEEFAKMSAARGRRAYVIDLMGFGRSSRPHPKVFLKTKRLSTKEKVDLAEDFFLKPLEEFRVSQKITAMHITAHSLGGYLSTAYALQYPNLVKALILLSPAGIPSLPPSHGSSGAGANAGKTPADDSPDGAQRNRASGKSLADALAMEVGIGSGETETEPGPRENRSSSWDVGQNTHPGHSGMSLARDSTDPTTQSDGDQDPEDEVDEDDDEEEEEEEEGEKKQQTFKGPLGKSGKLTSKLYAYMWESGLSPLGFIRRVGPIGPLMIGKYASHRFASIAPSEADDLASYLTNITCLPGSGEYSVGLLLRPGAFARFPLVDRIAGIGKSIPVTFVYGEKDWMDRHGGKAAVKALRAVGNRRSQVVICPEAGHHVYIDNPEFINRLLWEKLAGSSSSDMPSPMVSPTSSAFPSRSHTRPSSPLSGQVTKDPLASLTGGGSNSSNNSTSLDQQFPSSSFDLGPHTEHRLSVCVN